MTIQNKRHHQQRVKNNRKHYIISGMNNNPRHIGKVAKTPGYCNCMYCTNPRKYGELDLKERKMIEATKLEFYDI